MIFPVIFRGFWADFRRTNGTALLKVQHDGIKTIANIFDEVDEDDSGTLDAQEVQVLAARLGLIMATEGKQQATAVYINHPALC